MIRLLLLTPRSAHGHIKLISGGVVSEEEEARFDQAIAHIRRGIVAGQERGSGDGFIFASHLVEQSLESTLKRPRSPEIAIVLDVDIKRVAAADRDGLIVRLQSLLARHAETIVAEVHKPSTTSEYWPLPVLDEALGGLSQKTLPVLVVKRARPASGSPVLIGLVALCVAGLAAAVVYLGQLGGSDLPPGESSLPPTKTALASLENQCPGARQALNGELSSDEARSLSRSPIDLTPRLPNDDAKAKARLLRQAPDARAACTLRKEISDQRDRLLALKRVIVRMTNLNEIPEDRKQDPFLVTISALKASKYFLDINQIDFKNQPFLDAADMDVIHVLAYDLSPRLWRIFLIRRGEGNINEEAPESAIQMTVSRNNEIAETIVSKKNTIMDDPKFNSQLKKDLKDVAELFINLLGCTSISKGIIETLGECSKPNAYAIFTHGGDGTKR